MAPICPDLMMLFTASGRTPAARATSRTLKTSGTDVLAVDIDSVGCGAISLPVSFCAVDGLLSVFRPLSPSAVAGMQLELCSIRDSRQKRGHRHMSGCQGARVPGVPGCQGARVPGVPGCQGARVPRAHVRRAHVPRATCGCHVRRTTHARCQGATCLVPCGASRSRATYYLRPVGVPRAATWQNLAARRRTSQHLVEPRRTRTLQNLVEPRRTQQNLFLTLFEVC
jgi:hypothetical protein